MRDVIDGALADRVLARLGLADRPQPTKPGLDALYAAWCDGVPFDNVIKRVHLSSGSTAPFPNADPATFFELYLRHGTGGTCWPSTLALHALLTELGFTARLGSASMYDDRAGRVHTHGTIIVRFDRADGEEYWVDTSMLTERPVPLRRRVETRLEHPFRPVRVEPVDDLWRVHWFRQSFPESIGCLLLDDDVAAEHCRTRYEVSRTMSPFNTSLHACSMRGGRSTSITTDQLCENDETGFRHRPLGDERVRVLVERFGYSEEIVERSPADEPVT